MGGEQPLQLAEYRRGGPAHFIDPGTGEVTRPGPAWCSTALAAAAILARSTR